MTARIDPPRWMAAVPARAVIDALGGSDHCRFVGGCVRDAILGAVPRDIDLATTRPPLQALAALQTAGIRAIPTGIDHGTITAVIGDDHLEVTSLRRDVSTDGRHAVVAYTEDWNEDARRRDFTINALYADAQGRLFDPVGGLADLTAGRVRFVGTAATRIAEDYLRALRFFRFHTRFDRGPPDAAAVAAVAASVDQLPRLSGERIAGELVQLMAAPDPRRGLMLMAELGVLKMVIGPDAAPDAAARVILRERRRGLNDPWRRLIALLPTDRGRLDQLGRTLRLSRREAQRAQTAAQVDATALETPPRRRAAFYRHGVEATTDRAFVDAGDAGLDAVIAEGPAWQRPVLPVGGSDAIDLGIAAGPAIGQTLAGVEARWIAGDFTADRATCLAWLAAEAPRQG